MRREYRRRVEMNILQLSVRRYDLTRGPLTVNWRLTFTETCQQTLGNSYDLLGLQADTEPNFKHAFFFSFNPI